MFATGALWLLFHYFVRVHGEFGDRPHALEIWWLRLHGAAAMLTLLVLGSLVPIHVRRGWHQRKNLLAGAILGTLAVTHPDRDLTDHILRGVVGRMYEEPYSGRRLLALLQDAGLAHVRLRTDVYQDMTLEPYSKGFLERRAELGVRFGLVDAATAQRWLDGFTALVAAGHFLMTLNFYGVVGVRSSRALRR